MKGKKKIFSAAKQAMRVPVSAARLPKHVDQLYDLKGKVEQLEQTIQQTLESNKQILHALQKQEAHVTSVDTRLAQLTSAIAALKSPSQKNESSSISDRFSDNHDLDDFYLAFENKFRGSEDAIKERVKIYPEQFKKLKLDFSTYPVVDIGCGRGELLESFSEHGIRAIGLDINHAMVKAATDNGFEAVQGDALTYLRSLESNSVAGVTGMHIVEHLPFGELIALFKECYRVTVPGGAIAFETPNPENLIVGIFGFYMDPSHLNPIPAPLLAFAIEHSGFTPEVIHLHPSNETQPTYDDPMLTQLANRIYGAFDYAVIGTKPGTKPARKTKK